MFTRSQTGNNQDDRRALKDVSNHTSPGLEIQGDDDDVPTLLDKNYSIGILPENMDSFNLAQN